jgi:hypothetical protein
MEKKLFIKDDKRIGETIAVLTEFAETVENNMNILDIYNERLNLIDKQYIYELTNLPNESNVRAIQKYMNSINPLDTINTNEKIKNLFKILYTIKSSDGENADYFELFIDLEPIQRKNLNVFTCGELETKNTYEFDYKNNKVTIKQSVIDYINEKYTTYLTTKNQIKAFEIIKNIDSKIQELKNNYQVNGDIITNDIYNDIFKSYTTNNLFIPKTINYQSVYQNIICKIKD